MKSQNRNNKINNKKIKTLIKIEKTDTNKQQQQKEKRKLEKKKGT